MSGRSLRLLGAAVISAGLLGAACGSSSGGASPTASAAGDSSAAPTTAAATAAFPVTIEHKFGTITIDEPPQRVVSVGYNEQDWLYAFGVEPVGVREWYGDYPYATWPWADAARGDAKPEVLAGEELNIEAVAALRPDLIVGIYAGLTEEDYALLSKIAPVLAPPSEFNDYSVPWREQTRLIGKALGQPAKAEQLVADLEKKLAAARAANPQFAGTEAVVGSFYQGKPGAYAPGDLRNRVLTDLGFVIPANYESLSGGEFYFEVSPENLGLLDVDAVVWLVFAADGSARKGIETNPVYPSLGLSTEGRSVWVDSQLLEGAFSFSSPLSLDFALDHLVPMLAAAIDGNAATPVPPSPTTIA